MKMPELPADEKTSQEERRSLNYKLGLLVIIATCALVSIVLISQQLIVRHLAGDLPPATLQLTIPREGWSHPRLTHPADTSQDFLVQIFHYDSDADSSTEGMVEVEGKMVEEGEVVEEGLYWSGEVLESLTAGPDSQTLQDQILELRGRKVKSLEEPSWSRCGQQAGQNRFVTFLSGFSACARYREPQTHLVLGELMSFYLARLLGMTNVPAVVLSQVEPHDPVWAGVLQDVETAGWNYGSTVALIQWVEEEDLARDNMPDLLRRALLDRQTIDPTSSQLTVRQAAQLAQWSDLVVFDFITANYDRVASMQDAAQREGQPEILSERVHNLLTSRATGRLWMIDNEAGLLDGYSLLYPASDQMAGEAERFQEMHRDLLHTLCIFKRSTVAAVFALYKSGDAASLLDQFIARNEPLYREVYTQLPGGQKVWKQHFQQRIEEVWIWMKQCQESVGFSHQ